MSAPSSNLIRVESLDQEGRGVAHADGKVIFINGALPGELVTYSTYRRKPAYELAEVHGVVKPAAMRTTPRCKYFGTCGGCSMQHIDARAQVAAKQRVLEDSLAHIGKVQAEQILPAIHGEPWGYRHRARFSARHVPKKGGALIGFREKRSSYVADMETCLVVPARISALLMPLRELINKLSMPDRLPQIELAIGGDSVVLVLRILQPLTAEDERLLREFADRNQVHFFLQPRGPDTAQPYYPAHGGVLYYCLPEFALKIGFSPTEFTQVNPAVNAVLVRRAMALLGPRADECIADMFCGLGNFTLAIARSGARVLGVEGSDGLVSRAQANAELNQLSPHARFLKLDLFRVDRAGLAQLGGFDRMLIDPPRDGAVQLINALPDVAPRRIVYVSCNAATLARDAGILVHTKGYVLSAAGVVNMFPHTSHVESIAVFDKAD